MGCWNKTCGLSNLHIKCGESVYVFVLEQNDDETDRSYSTSFWSPILLPFESEYNDYGDGENSSGIALNYVINAVKNSLVEIGQGSNKFHDIPVSRDTFNEEVFWESVREHRLFVQGYNTEDLIPVEYVMFRKDIVDSILENYEIEQYVGDGKGTCGYNNNYTRYKFKDILADIPEFINLVQNEKVKKRLQFGMGFRGLDSLKGNKVANWCVGDNYRMSSILNPVSVFSELLLDNKLDEAVEVIKAHLIGSFINEFMEVSRKNWAPAGHEGSQSQESKPYRVLCNAINAALDEEGYDEE